MLSKTRARRIAVLATQAATCATLMTMAPAAGAAPRADGSDFSCRASVARVALKLPVAQTIEPFVANAPNAPCVPDDAGLLNPTAIGPVTVDAASAETMQTPENLASAPAKEGDNATARATVTNPVATLPGAAISAGILNASASYTCQGGQPVAAASTRVVGLVVNGTAITVPAGDAPLTIPLGPAGSLKLNEIVQEPNRVTARALVLSTPAADVIIAEAIADFTGNPCKPPTQCSDQVDNDGDGKIDAQDPGCLSGPGGTYDPNDDSEIDFPCSDLADNDGDGKIDAKDPGCLSGPGGTYNPMDTDERDSANASSRPASGRARLGTRPAAIARLGLKGPCTRKSFAAVVTGRSIRSVVFSLDGRRLRTVRSSPFSTRVAPTTAGNHRLTARVTFLAGSRTKARTLGFAFKRCAAPVRFTG